MSHSFVIPLYFHFLLLELSRVGRLRRLISITNLFLSQSIYIVHKIKPLCFSSPTQVPFLVAHSQPEEITFNRDNPYAPRLFLSPLGFQPFSFCCIPLLGGSRSFTSRIEGRTQHKGSLKLDY